MFLSWHYCPESIIIPVILYLSIMKKFLATFILIASLVQSTYASYDVCRSFAYGYMSDGKVYMMLEGKKYGPFEDMTQFKFTLDRFGPQFKENLKRYMLMEPNGSAEKYLVYRDELGECNPYVLDMDTIASWNAKITALFVKLDARYGNDHYAYRNVLTNALNNINTKLNANAGSQKTLEILKLVRDRIQKKLQSL